MRVVGLLFLSLFIACAPTATAPESLIPESEMVQILTDIHVADASVEFMRLESSEDLYSYKNAFFEDVMEEHGIDQETFESSFDYYATDLEQFAFLYDSVLVEISKRDALVH